eukprot:5264481-Prymnesium_polylepis.1
MQITDAFISDADAAAPGGRRRGRPAAPPVSLAEGLDTELRTATLARAEAAERQLEATLAENARLVADAARARRGGGLSRDSLQSAVQVVSRPRPPPRARAP